MLVELAKVTLAVLVALPIVRPVSVESKLQPLVVKVLENESETDSIRSLPVPENVLLDGLGTLFRSTKVPLLIVVVPL